MKRKGGKQATRSGNLAGGEDCMEDQEGVIYLFFSNTRRLSTFICW